MKIEYEAQSDQATPAAQKLDQPTLETVNSWRNLQFLGAPQLNYYQQLYQNKLARRQIYDRPERQKQKLRVDDLDVWFPHALYACQKDYITKALDAVKRSQNAMLESPTGTGKTISLLCAITAFIKRQRETGGNPNTTLIYCTRTHSQIQQVIDEINNNLPYYVRANILAAKTKLCLHDKARNKLDARQLENRCQKLRSSKRPDQGDEADLERNMINERQSACPFYHGQEILMAQEGYKKKRFNPIIDMVEAQIPASASSRCLDIEELMSEGARHNVCPYYLSKSRVPTSDIVVMPYSYMLNAQIREKLQLQIKDSIVVFDEAHNIDSNCEEIYSFEIEIQQAWRAFFYLERYSKNGGDFSGEESYDIRQRKKQAISLKCFLLKFMNSIKQKNLTQYRNALGSVQRCITNIFILEISDFMQILDPLLLEVGEKFHYVPVVDEEETGSVLQKQDFQPVQPVYGFTESQEDQQPVEHQGSDAVQVQKDGRTFRRYTRLDSAIIEEELNKLIQAGYQCFETKNEPQQSCGQPNSEAVVAQQPQLNNTNQNAAKLASDAGDKQVLSQVIDMFAKIRKIKNLLKTLQPSRKVEDFKMFIRTNKNNNYQKGSNNSEQHITHFGVHCLNPAYVFKQLLVDEKPRSVILTSGTLSPMKILKYDLDSEFRVQLVGEHFIRESQVFATIVSTDYQGNKFKFNFDNKDLNKSYKDLCKLVHRLNQNIKGGILMFFTSYTHITDCYKQFLESKFDFGLAKIFIEDKDAHAANKNYEAYKQHIQDHCKGIFMCVSRGKLSEGLNFENAMARACLVIGIPYLLVNDARVNLKKAYLDDCLERYNQIQAGTLSEGAGQQLPALRIMGDYWYKITAIREVNQIIGRCIRHNNDYSSIFLIDERYQAEHINKHLSKWVRDRLRVYQNYDVMEDELKQFFLENQLREFNRQQEQRPVQQTIHAQMDRSDDFLKKSSDQSMKNQMLLDEEDWSQLNLDSELAMSQSYKKDQSQLDELISIPSQFLRDDSDVYMSQQNSGQQKPTTVTNSPSALLEERKDELPEDQVLIGSQTYDKIFEEQSELDDDYLCMVLESQKQQTELGQQDLIEDAGISDITTGVPQQVPPQPLVKRLAQDSSEDDTEKFMRAFVANQSTCEILGRADQQLIYGNVGLKGTPRGSDNEEDKATRATYKQQKMKTKEEDTQNFNFKRRRLN